MVDGPIERYLDDLLVASRRLPPREARQLLAEAEAHLRDCADTQIAAGTLVDEAEANAVQRFGDARALAAADGRTSLKTIVSQVALTALLLGGIAGIGIGISGAIAAVFRAAGGDRLVAGGPTVSALSASNCARWLAIDPSAASCHDAALNDWANETVYYRLAVGVLGILAVLGYAAVRRRRSHRPALNPLVTDTAATVLWTGAAVVLFALGVDALVISAGDGAGQWLSAAPVALVAALWYGTKLTKTLTHISN